MVSRSEIGSWVTNIIIMRDGRPIRHYANLREPSFNLRLKLLLSPCSPPPPAATRRVQAENTAGETNCHTIVDQSFPECGSEGLK